MSAEESPRRVVTIEYCVMCMDLPKAIEVADRVLKDYQWDLDGLMLKPGGKGVFEVYLNGDKIFSKVELDRFPTYEEIEAILTERIGPPADIFE